jgi:hypothetical protein
MVPKAPDSELRKDSNPLVEALFNYQLIHIEAYVVHVDMVSQHEVAFKLTPETIEALIEYHKDIYSVDVSASTWEWAEKEQQLKKLQDGFVQAVNRYVFRTGVKALEGLEEDGAGELLEGRGEDVKSAIMGLFLPLLPPPPRIVDVVRPAPLLPSSPGSANWWVPTQHYQSHSAPVDQWRVVPSTPSPTIATCGETGQTFWSTMGTMGFEAIQLPSPTPSYSQPYNSTSPYAQSTSPYAPSTSPYAQSTSPYAPSTSPYTSSSYYSPPPASAPIPNLPLPSVLAQQCGSSAVHGGFGGFGWDTGFAPQYAAFT